MINATATSLSLDWFNSSSNATPHKAHTLFDVANGRNSIKYFPNVCHGVILRISICTALLSLGAFGNLRSVYLIFGDRSHATGVKTPRGAYEGRGTRQVQGQRPQVQWRVRLRKNWPVTNLLLADCLIVFIFLPSEMAWLYTHYWLGGEALCRLVAPFRLVGFYAMSFSMLAIALDRLSVVRCSRERYQRRCERHAGKLSVVLWSLAVALSAPNAAVYSTVEISGRPGYYQCNNVKIFSSGTTSTTRNWRQDLNNHKANNATGPLNYSFTTHAIINQGIAARAISLAKRIDDLVMPASPRLSEHAEMVNIVLGSIQAIFMFWLPLAGIVVCYYFICQLVRKSLRMPSESEIAESGRLIELNEAADIGRIISVRRTQSYQAGQRYDDRWRSNQPATSRRQGQCRPSDSGEILLSPRAIRKAASATQESKLRNRRRNAWKMATRVIVPYIVCWTPFQCLTMWSLLDPTGYDRAIARVQGTATATLVLAVSNACVNPFLYDGLQR